MSPRAATPTAPVRGQIGGRCGWCEVTKKAVQINKRVASEIPSPAQHQHNTSTTPYDRLSTQPFICSVAATEMALVIDRASRMLLGGPFGVTGRLSSPRRYAASHA